MTCRKIVKQLPAYLANELPDRARSRIEAHLKHCTLCTAELGALKRTDQLLGTLPEIEPRRDLVGLVMQHIERERDTVPAFKRFLLSLRARQAQLRYAAANVLLVVLLAFTIIHFEGSRRAAQVAESRSSLTNPGGDARVATTLSETRKPAWRFLRPDEFRAFLARNRPVPVYRLTNEQIEALNREFAKARSTGDNNLETPGWDPGAEGIVPVDAPFILRPGPNGELLIERQSGSPEPASDEAAEQPAKAPGDEAAGE
jgi:hypothetical protein